MIYYLTIIHNCAIFKRIERSARKAYYIYVCLYFQMDLRKSDNFFHLLCKNESTIFILLTFHFLNDTIRKKIMIQYL